MFRSLSLCSAAALAAALSFGMSTPAGALTMKECSAKYQEAKKADTLKGMKWNDFRKAECADEDASEADAAAAEKAAPKPTAAESKPTTTATKPGTEKAAPKPTAGGAGAFPTEVSSKYANEKPGKARMNTCLDQYRANKESGANQPKWIEKGGGYYSQCNAKLKNAGA